MLTFTKQTTESDEGKIERMSMRFQDKGFRGHIIVYRNSVDTALAKIALSTAQHKGQLTSEYVFDSPLREHTLSSRPKTTPTARKSANRSRSCAK